MVIVKGEPDLAFVGLLLLIVFGVMIWKDRPIQSPRPYETPYTQPLDRQVHNYSYISHPWEDPFGFDPGALQERNSYQLDIDTLPDFLNPNNVFHQKKLSAIRLHKSNDAEDLTQTTKHDEGLCGTQLSENLKKKFGRSVGIRYGGISQNCRE
ncbi:MAG: hypothetical protein H6936_11490 [Burkholderiales bacterium]|nr:hypothetical protein [Nitrosomonas sp.]MCP5275443.1 hypothetical protein [Burkholderiales bacterium]